MFADLAIMFADLAIMFADFAIMFADLAIMFADFAIMFADFAIMLADFAIMFADFAIMFADFAIMFAGFAIMFAGFAIMFADLAILFADLAIMVADLAILFADFAIMFADLAIMFANLAILFADLAIMFADLAIIFADLAIMFAGFAIMFADLAIMVADLAIMFADFAIMFADFAIMFADLAILFADLAIMVADFAIMFADLAIMFADSRPESTFWIFGKPTYRFDLREGRLNCCQTQSTAAADSKWNLIQICESFPKEDSDQRCLEQRWQRGGNASNNCTVLSQLGAPCEFFGTVSKGVFADYVESDFRDLNISCDNCIVHEGCDFPLSSVIINKENGSRTIIHSNRNLPELTAEDFHKLDLSKYCWIHFEGRRNTSAISAMMRRVIHYNEEERSENQPRVRLSVELEKANRTQLLDLIPLCDVSFVGKDFATSQAYSTMSDTIRLLKPSLSPGSQLVVAWGDRGAMGVSKDGKIVQSIAYTPTEIVDTLGAGDTFVAATIFQLVNGGSLQESITFGCKLAGAKIAIEGLKNLVV
ncbi:hypothetical protein M8J77_009992 [Diaphorina citri]|nr:hypothetical protein M8J77_009992 [Diaphorina citri]